MAATLPEGRQIVAYPEILKEETISGTVLKSLKKINSSSSHFFLNRNTNFVYFNEVE